MEISESFGPKIGAPEGGRNDWWRMAFEKRHRDRQKKAFPWLKALRKREKRSGDVTQHDTMGWLLVLGWGGGGFCCIT